MTTPSEPLDLTAIEARANAATAGPWVDEVSQGGIPQVFAASVWGRFVARIVDAQDDAEFIAHARTDIPALVDRLHHADAAIERVRTLHTRRADSQLPWCAGCGRAWPCLTLLALDPQEGT